MYFATARGAIYVGLHFKLKSTEFSAYVLSDLQSHPIFE